MKHKKMMKKVLSLILCLTLLFPEVPVRAEGETEGEAGEWENTSSEEAYGLKDPRLIHEWWSNIFEYDTIWFGSYFLSMELQFFNFNYSFSTSNCCWEFSNCKASLNCS